MLKLSFTRSFTLSFALLFMAFFSWPLVAHSEPEVTISFEEPVPIPASRQLKVELSTLLLSTSSRYAGFGFGYVQRIAPRLSWQVANVRIFARSKTDLSERLLRDFGLASGDEPTLSGYASTALEWDPFRFKFAILNKRVVWSRIGVSLGLGTAQWTSLGSRPLIDLATTYSFDLGPEWSGFWSLKNLVFLDSTLGPELELTAGFSKSL